MIINFLIIIQGDSMNKKWMMVIIGILIFWLVGCGKEDIENREAMEHAQADVTEVCAYIRAVEGDILVIDPVEYISSEDSDRFASYKHTEDDMPDGYYLYNEDEETENVRLTAQTEYSFLDWTREFGGTDEDIRVITKDKKIFEKYLDTYTDGKPGMPFFLELDGGEVVRILEKPMA